MRTSELLDAIQNRVLLSPSSEYHIKRYLMHLDGVTLTNDLYDEDEEEED